LVLLIRMVRSGTGIEIRHTLKTTPRTCSKTLFRDPNLRPSFLEGVITAVTRYLFACLWVAQWEMVAVLASRE
jgi:hypothetical protein